MRGANVRTMIEQFRQILECQLTCLLLVCPDRALRHPLLDFWPGKSMPVICSGSPPSGWIQQPDFWMEEPVHALCDLAIQSGCMRVLDRYESAVRRGLQSLAAFPLDTPAGVLGVLLLADERPACFGAGEASLLYACLSIYAKPLEHALWEEARALLLNSSETAAGGEGVRTLPDQFPQSEFISMVGHELRAPLSVIKGYAGLLRAYGGGDDPALTPDRRNHYLDVIMEQTGLLEVLVNDLLDLSRMQRGKLVLRPRSVDIEALCRKVIQLGQLRADQFAPGKYKLECRLAGPLPPIWADADRLQQILMNILENAIKYSPEGGRIELEARLEGAQRERMRVSHGQRAPERVCFIVRDQGVGISPQHLTHLFQPFERLERPAIAHIPGTGLGLSITRRLVEAMGGGIEVRSCEGRGTNVTISLPMTGPGEVIAPEIAARLSSLTVG